MITRRSLFRGLGALLAAPAIVKVASIMPVSRQPIIVVLPEGPTSDADLAEIILRTIRENATQFSENVRQHNALWRRLAERGLA